jgi:hypothetical protein
MVYKFCMYNECKKNAYYDDPGGKGRYCGTHKSITMINIRSKKCEFENCNMLNPVFDYPGGKRRYCFTHKKDGMIDVKTRRCKHSECDKRPCFGNSKDGAIYCLEHKLPDMYDIKHKMCIYDNCKVRASFDKPGGKGKYCEEHKEPDMIDVKHAHCEYINCNIRPTFGYPFKKAQYCVVHKIDGMIDVINKYCEKENCIRVNPSFDIIGGKGRFCFEHKLDNMINIKSLRCLYEGCKKIATFGILNDIAQYCNEHKTSEMVDIKHKKCNECNTRAIYGKAGSNPIYCAKHRKLGMIKRPNSNCIIKGCNQKAIYGTFITANHCNNHKTTDDINILENKCILCGLNMILDNNQKCEFCNPQPNSKNYLTKQNKLMTYLDSLGLYGITTDKIINNGECGKERPDRVYDLNDKIIIIECDENQHKDREKSCEITRMKNISQSFGGIPVYFIRWNPDKYKLFHSSHIPESLTARHKLVGKLLFDIHHNKYKMPHALLSVLYLYYDNWNGIENQVWDIITPFDS